MYKTRNIINLNNDVTKRGLFINNENKRKFDFLNKIRNNKLYLECNCPYN